MSLPFSYARQAPVRRRARRPGRESACAGVGVGASVSSRLAEAAGLEDGHRICGVGRAEVHARADLDDGGAAEAGALGGELRLVGLADKPGEGDGKKG